MIRRGHGSGTGRKSRRFRAFTGVVAAVAVSVGVAGCAGSALGSASAQGSPSGIATHSDPTGTTRFTATTVQGGTVRIPSAKPTVLFFFSVECGSCGPESGVLAQAQKANPNAANFVVVDVAPTESAATITSFLTQNHAATMAYAIDTNAHLIAAYQIQALSTAVVLNPAGKVVYTGVDPSAAVIRAVLKKAGAA
ncbi:MULTISPECIES: thioredoxin-like domain-containing protein [Microbacteriaceae]|uniref:TlpA family protein disulfide reductase n=1 Tax=Microbacteriaceae TaxID=85023 RepID=UPI0009BF5E96|nr:MULTISPECIES: thioredoxin-like domain-containing protein [Microbacteriaceae]